MDDDGMMENGQDDDRMRPSLVALPVDDATMEDIIDKLKILEYESEFCLRNSFRPITHAYFTRPSPNPNEQFFVFTSLVAWLFQLAGERFQAPTQFDEPNASATSIISTLRSMGFNVKDIAPGCPHSCGVSVLLSRQGEDGGGLMRLCNALQQWVPLHVPRATCGLHRR